MQCKFVLKNRNKEIVICLLFKGGGGGGPDAVVIEPWCNSLYRRVSRFSFGMMKVIGMMNNGKL